MIEEIIIQEIIEDEDHEGEEEIITETQDQEIEILEEDTRGMSFFLSLELDKITLFKFKPR